MKVNKLSRSKSFLSLPSMDQSGTYCTEENHPLPFTCVSVYCSAYEVQFYVVKNPVDTGNEEEDVTIPEDLQQSSETLPSAEEARESSKPLSFKICYNNDSFPESVMIDEELLMNALKKGATYSVVTVAITETDVSEPCRLVPVTNIICTCI